ncbi:MAG: hypothetical protein P4L74_02965 [Candidatus Doudnabacteria bacterium]|nr:hypothetical protein [Candidatus Doudnabacteria bacterium]
MKALLSLKSAINQSRAIGIMALVTLLPVLFPHLAFADSQTAGSNPAQIFEIKISDPKLLDPNITPKDNQSTQPSLSMQDATDNDPLVIDLKQYLADNGSPLGQYAAQIVQQPQWQRALAISYVESHMGVYCYDNNCSGMGGAPGTPTWRKYATKLDWFIDLSNLLEKPIYKDTLTTFKQMRGVYVQPGSNAWVYGAQKKFDELMTLTAVANSQRQALAQAQTQQLQQNLALNTFPVSNP